MPGLVISNEDSFISAVGFMLLSQYQNVKYQLKKLV